MIAELLLVLGGHESSLFSPDCKVQSTFRSLLHPGELEILESLAVLGSRFRKIQRTLDDLLQSQSRYILTVCSTLQQILRSEYQSLVVDTESLVLHRDPSLVASGSNVPLSSIRSAFTPWDAPLLALCSLMEDLSGKEWEVGPLMDMLSGRCGTGIASVADIMHRLSLSVQRVWTREICAYLHGRSSSLSSGGNFWLLADAVPSCISDHTRESITYIGNAVGTVAKARSKQLLPRDMILRHTSVLDSVLPEDYAFDRVVSEIRAEISNFLWSTVLTRKDVEDAIDLLSNYFLLRNGEFALSFIREIERLKLSRLTSASGSSAMIREQDLSRALLRASIGTTAQDDPSLARLRVLLPHGPTRPLLPSLLAQSTQLDSSSSSDATVFLSHMLGTPMILTYQVSFPLSLFLDAGDLEIYSALFGFLSSLRSTHNRTQICWSSLSNSQRQRRSWTGLNEGGDVDLESRKQLLRRGWAILRQMSEFLHNLTGYLMIDVVDLEFNRLKTTLSQTLEQKGKNTDVKNKPTSVPSDSDFTALRKLHSDYLHRLFMGSLLGSPILISFLQSIFAVCNRFSAQVERWGGDVLPALLSESSEKVGLLVMERSATIDEIDECLCSFLDQFHEQLSLATSQHTFASTDASRSILSNRSNLTNYNITRATRVTDSAAEVGRQIERLLLRLDFNAAFRRRRKETSEQNILAQGGIGS